MKAHARTLAITIELRTLIGYKEKNKSALPRGSVITPFLWLPGKLQVRSDS
jgi:hypothetical protein